MMPDRPINPITSEAPWVRRVLIALALGALGILLVAPLAVVFRAAFADGVGPYLSALDEPDTRAAIKLTLIAAGIAVPANLVFGIAAAWTVSRFSFPGRRALVAVIDLPFAVSPVIAGMLFILLFGAHGVFKPGVDIVFAVPGIVMVTAFVTVPFVARELMPALEARGPEQELAALTLGASPLQVFVRVTLPNLGWPLAYGAILCTARAIGEFGAVSVVSGHVRGETNTVPLHVEILYNEFHYREAFAVSTILILIALGTVALKSVIAWQIARRRR